ncbi:MAG: response regulator [Candidatus Sericytochromatia bacterium]|uniref:Response regulator n=1 Tax=Candidatus Tanganyikabacteria bacterium TaxID=2961651 RepID=A0A937X909_9BACT|nr:response regulator [Candidatus Tanganyikabacteria bacterium]
MRVLIVEDERITLNAIKLIVESAGHQALLADRSEEGLQLARSEHPEVALVDIKMKESAFDGLELIRRLRSDEATCKTVIIAHTASVSPPSIAAAMQAGANDVLRKPFRQAELLDIIKRNLVK